MQDALVIGQLNPSQNNRFTSFSSEELNGICQRTHVCIMLCFSVTFLTIVECAESMFCASINII